LTPLARSLSSIQSEIEFTVLSSRFDRLRRSVTAVRKIRQRPTLFSPICNPLDLDFLPRRPSSLFEDNQPRFEVEIDKLSKPVIFVRVTVVEPKVFTTTSVGGSLSLPNISNEICSWIDKAVDLDSIFECVY